MYRADKSQFKQGTREVILRELYSITPARKQVRNVVTLCNKNFWLERELLRKYPKCKVTSFEYDRRTYLQAEKKKPYRLKLLNENVFQHDFSETQYDFFWLDLCNSYSKETINNTIELLSKLHFAKNSMFVVTLNKARGRMRALRYGEYYGNYKNSGVVYHLGAFIKANVSSVQVLQYACQDVSNKANQMQAFIFKLNPND